MQQKRKVWGLNWSVFCDEFEESWGALAEFGGFYATTNADRIMRDDSIDLVVIATHHDAHHPLALAGAKAGKHILLEKPMCVTRAQAVESLRWWNGRGSSS